MNQRNEMTGIYLHLLQNTGKLSKNIWDWNCDELPRIILIRCTVILFNSVHQHLTQICLISLYTRSPDARFSLFFHFTLSVQFRYVNFLGRLYVIKGAEGEVFISNTLYSFLTNKEILIPKIECVCDCQNHKVHFALQVILFINIPI